MSAKMLSTLYQRAIGEDTINRANVTEQSLLQESESFLRELLYLQQLLEPQGPIRDAPIQNHTDVSDVIEAMKACTGSLNQVKETLCRGGADVQMTEALVQGSLEIASIKLLDKEVYELVIDNRQNEDLPKNFTIALITNQNIVIPLKTIPQLPKYAKTTCTVTIPLNILLLNGEITIVLLDNDERLTEKKFTPTEILEITNKEQNLQLKIRNNLGLPVNVSICEQNSGQLGSLQLKQNSVVYHELPNMAGMIGNFYISRFEYAVVISNIETIT